MSRCAFLEVDGVPGITIRTGHWLNLDTLQWEARAGPTYNPLAGEVPNDMWSFRGRPTIFGNPFCDEDFNCVNTEVLQYDPEADAWAPIGYLSEGRYYHEVVEVPRSFCQAVATFTTTTQSPEANNAALIIGGYDQVSVGKDLGGVIYKSLLFIMQKRKTV